MKFISEVDAISFFYRIIANCYDLYGFFVYAALNFELIILKNLLCSGCGRLAVSYVWDR